MYQQVNLADRTLVGALGPLPANLVGLSDAVLADISAHIIPAPVGLAGQGFWPVVIAPPANFDPTSQVAVDPTSYAADQASGTVKGQQTARAMTAAEFLAANPVPASISDRQFGQGLWSQGIITYAECQAFVATGTIPAALQTIINQLPDDTTGAPTQRKIATVIISGAKEYDRANPLVDTLGTAFGWSSAQIDANWRAWALL